MHGPDATCITEAMRCRSLGSSQSIQCEKQGKFTNQATSADWRTTVSTTRLDYATIEIALADHGPGFAKDVMERPFEPFVSTKRNGMGLGLSICRTIVESHGGRIKATQNFGGGCISLHPGRRQGIE
jgi:signal transduction histidine kinase